MPEAKAIARFVHVSPQKARLVVDLIRGMRAEDALHRLRFTPKRIARDVAKLLQSAIANASDRGDVDVDALYVTRAFVNEGPRQKRIRPAPMGRAYRYQRRTAHIELHVGERVGAASLTRRVGEVTVPAAATPARHPTARKPAAKKPAAKKAAAGKAGARKPAAAGKKSATGKKAATGKPGSVAGKSGGKKTASSSRKPKGEK
ncbi:MAG: 50S ribosomal protein L22 [Terriglobales bacterium]